MKVEQLTWSDSDGWHTPAAIADAQLVLVFGDRAAIGSARLAGDVAAQWPAAVRAGCSTAGQIHGTEVFDEGVIATAVKFDHTRVRIATAPVTAAGSASAGAALADQLADPELVHVLILSEGLDINGEALVCGRGERRRVEEEVEGVRDVVGPHASITGFYSYGEISPFTPQARCELHNQTMTVTTFAER